KVEKYDQAIEVSKNVSERKELRSARKKPKQDRKALQDYIVRKQKYQNDMLIFDGRNSYSKTDHDATFMRMKDDYIKNGQLKVEKYDQANEVSKNVSERKELRSARKKPKQDRKALQDYIVRKQKYQNDMLIFDGRNSYSKTDHDATFMRMKDDYMKNGQLK